MGQVSNISVNTTPPHTRRTVVLNAAFGPIEGYENDLITSEIEQFGAHTRPLLAMLLSFIEPGDVILDAGAHIGSFSVPMAKKAQPGGKLIAIEANPETFLLLQRNLARNAILADTFCNAVSESPGKILYLNLQDTNTGADSIVALPTNSGVIETVRIDDITNGPVHILKIDVEGMEFAALRSASYLIAQSRPIILIEYDKERLEARGENPKALEEFLRKHGYNLFINIGDLNAAHDDYTVVQLENTNEIEEIKTDLLCIPKDSSRSPARALSTNSSAFKYYIFSIRSRRLVGQMLRTVSRRIPRKVKMVLRRMLLKRK